MNGMMNHAYRLLVDELNYLLERKDMCKQLKREENKFDNQIEHLRQSIDHLKIAMAEREMTR